MAGASRDKAAGALRTIGELSQELGIAQHVLRYWEGRFPQLQPMQRAGGRRYYRPEDIALVRRIHGLLEHEGFTIRGAQRLLAAGGVAEPGTAAPDGTAPLAAIRDRLAAALRDDAG